MYSLILRAESACCLSWRKCSTMCHLRVLKQRRDDMRAQEGPLHTIWISFTLVMWCWKQMRVPYSIAFNTQRLPEGILACNGVAPFACELQRHQVPWVKVFQYKQCRIFVQISQAHLI